MYGALVVTYALLLIGPASLAGGYRPTNSNGLLMVLMMSLAAAVVSRPNPRPLDLPAPRKRSGRNGLTHPRRVLYEDGMYFFTQRLVRRWADE